MKTQIFMCASSVTTLLASTIAVIFIIHTVVVPHIKQQAHIGSVCTVTDIRHHAVCDVCQTCALVTVSYADLNDKVREGYLLPRGENTLLITLSTSKVG